MTFLSENMATYTVKCVNSTKGLVITTVDVSNPSAETTKLLNG
jgi:hypothetical protein